jgi:hypothetical protein
MTVGVHQVFPWLPGEIGQLSATYESSGGNTTNMVFDVTGYFVGIGVVTPVTPTIVTTPSAGGAIGTTLTDKATLYGANDPTGTIDFYAYGPANPTCVGTLVHSSPNFVQSVSITDGLDATTTGFPATAAGTYHWIAVYSGDSNNNPVTSLCGEPVVVWAMATPTLATVPSAGGAIGTVLTDTANLTGAVSPTGTMTFVLYGPSTSVTCNAGDLDLAQAVAVTTNSTTTGSATTSIGFTTTKPGTYYWRVEYSGDTYNNLVGPTACGEPVNIQYTPTFTTTPSAGGAIGTILNDTATLTSTGPVLTGFITFNLYGPTDTTCAGPVLYAQTVTVAVHVTAPGFTTTIASGAGTYHWIASYGGDANTLAATSTCASEGVAIT